jgi:hypothetical protein
MSIQKFTQLKDVKFGNKLLPENCLIVYFFIHFIEIQCKKTCFRCNLESVMRRELGVMYTFMYCLKHHCPLQILK